VSGCARTPCGEGDRDETHLARKLAAKVLDVLVDARPHTAAGRGVSEAEVAERHVERGGRTRASA